MDGNELWDNGYKSFTICGMKILNRTRIMLIKQNVVTEYSERYEIIHNELYGSAWATIPMFVALNCDKKYPFGNPLFIKSIDVFKLSTEEIENKHRAGIEYLNKHIYPIKNRLNPYIAKEDVERFFNKKDFYLC